MADTNLTGLAFVSEVTWGTFPEGSPTLTNLRYTGESFSYNIGNIVSAEIRDDRQVTDLVQADADVTGGFDFELSYDDNGFGELFKAALWAYAWEGTINEDYTDVAMNTGGQIYSEYTDFSASSFATGRWIDVSGYTAAASLPNNTTYFITAHRATGLNVVPSPTVACAGTGVALTFKGYYCRNGTHESSYSFERKHTDVGQYFAYKGCVVNGLTLTATASAIVTGSFDFVGSSAALTQATNGDGSNTAAGTGDVMNAMSHVGRLMLEGSTAATTSCTFSTADEDLVTQEISFSIANNVRGIKGIGDVGNADVGVGTFEVTGTLNMHILDDTFYDRYTGDTEGALSFKVEDGDGNAYIFTFPRIKFETDTVNVGGQNDDVMENITWRAIRWANTGDNTDDYTMQIDKFPA